MPTLLKGHENEVVTVEYLIKHGLLCSGDANGAIKLWDVDQQKCTQTIDAMCEFGGGAVNSFCLHPTNEHILYVACGNQIGSLDLRNANTWIEKYDVSKDDINQISINGKGKLLAAADDEGEIQVIDLETKYVKSSLSNGHSSICSGVLFRPNNPWEIVSCGLDCKVLQWDLGRGRILNSLDFTCMDKDGPNENMLLNPPFAYSVALSNSGHYMGVGVGNCKVYMYEFLKLSKGGKKAGKKESPWKYLCSLEGHTGAVSQVIFPFFSPNNSILSCGQDKTVNYWQLGKRVEDHDIVEYLSEPFENEKKAIYDEPSVNFDESETPSVNDKEKRRENIGPTSSITHSEKINWICSRPGQRDNVFVADVSNEISVYSIECA
eukprot:Nk52_evm83s1444 gene=Nk52_evmTU83s1444